MRPRLYLRRGEGTEAEMKKPGHKPGFFVAATISANVERG